MSNGGPPFTYQGFLAIHYRLRDRLRAEGVTDYQAHRLRHTGLTNLYRAGYSAFDVQQLAGHADMANDAAICRQKIDQRTPALPNVLTKVYGRVG